MFQALVVSLVIMTTNCAFLRLAGVLKIRYTWVGVGLKQVRRATLERFVQRLRAEIRCVLTNVDVNALKRG